MGSNYRRTGSNALSFRYTKALSFDHCSSYLPINYIPITICILSTLHLCVLDPNNVDFKWTTPLEDKDTDGHLWQITGLNNVQRKYLELPCFSPPLREPKIKDIGLAGM